MIRNEMLLTRKSQKQHHSTITTKATQRKAKQSNSFKFYSTTLLVISQNFPVIALCSINSIKWSSSSHFKNKKKYQNKEMSLDLAMRNKMSHLCRFLTSNLLNYHLFSSWQSTSFSSSLDKSQLKYHSHYYHYLKQNLEFLSALHTFFETPFFLNETWKFRWLIYNDQNSYEVAI